MLVPVSRIPSTLPTTLLRNLTPARMFTPLTALRAGRQEVHPPHPSLTGAAGRSTSSALGRPEWRMSASRAFSLFGMTNTDRIIGSMTIHHLLRRTISGVSDGVSGYGQMMEPYGSVIRSMEPEFLKVGFKKTHESRYAVFFSDGTNKIELIKERCFHSSLVDKNGGYHCLWMLLEKMNSPETTQKNQVEWDALVAKYGLMDGELSDALRKEGYHAFLTLDLKQTIQFLETHKDPLAQLTSNTGCDHDYRYGIFIAPPARIPLSGPTRSTLH